MGHIGLTPQSIHALGGFKVQGKALDAARRARRRRGRARRGRLLRDRARVRARRGGADDHRVGPGPDDRHRRRPPLRRPGARVPRPARLRGRLAPPKFVRRYADARARTRRPRSSGSAPTCARARSRRARDVPHDRRHGRRARPLRPTTHARPSPSSTASTPMTRRGDRGRGRAGRRDRRRGRRCVAASARRSSTVTAASATRRPASRSRSHDARRRGAVRGSHRGAASRSGRRCLRVVVADTTRERVAGPARAARPRAVRRDAVRATTSTTDVRVHDVEASRCRSTSRSTTADGHAGRRRAPTMEPCPRQPRPTAPPTAERAVPLRARDRRGELPTGDAPLPRV